MPSKTEILDHAIEVLRRSEALTIDAVAREAGLTKPGVVHHFPTKEKLVVSVVDRITAKWEADLTSRAPAATTPREKLAAYVDYALTSDFDNSDLAFMVDVRIRDGLAEQWVARLSPWFGDDLEGTPIERASLRAARLIADGAWLNKAFGINVTRDDETATLRAITQRLIGEGTNS
ncbi:TetR/AcrR family transcriptional regulator [Plantibacter sp. Leaf314]|uniref:TetR/AcrR family transcriptional regulator n=1 Tax=Plantibacter sp. Leaf314 TaxID=1736333 RepID=UPI0006FB7894|nr:TetR/AcrR family transcriptional regulator [Plantibacter sp. Leaf314]KQQ49792.1 TetR family transcriptional regulator [Plantibacter sp. Leaf314]